MKLSAFILAVFFFIISCHTEVMAKSKQDNIGKNIFEHVSKSCPPQKEMNEDQNHSGDIIKQMEELENMMMKDGLLKENVRIYMNRFRNSANDFLDKYRLNERWEKPKINTEIKFGCQHQPDLSAGTIPYLHVLIQTTIYSLTLEKDINKEKIDVKDFKKVQNVLVQGICKLKEFMLQKNISGLEKIINSMVASKKKDINKIFSEKWKAFYLIESANKFVSSVQFSKDHSISVANSDHCLSGGKKNKKNENKSKKGKRKNKNQTKQRNNKGKKDVISKKKSISG